MSTRIPDVKLAASFTPTTYSHPTSSLKQIHLPSKLRVCIVGASRGIGAGIATSYAHALAPGSTLHLVARTTSAVALASVQKKAQTLNPGITVTALYADITTAASVADLAAELKTVHGSAIDILVLNSGWAGPEVVLNMTNGSPADFQSVFNVNTIGTYHVVHYLLPLVLASENENRQFLVVGTLASILTSGPIANTAYCVSKMAQLRLVEFASEQFGKEENGGVTCVAVHPGAVLTEGADESVPDNFRPCELPFSVVGREPAWKSSMFLAD